MPPSVKTARKQEGTEEKQVACHSCNALESPRLPPEAPCPMWPSSGAQLRPDLLNP